MATKFEDFPQLISRLGIVPVGLIHVGAHEGQEIPYYQMAGFDNRITLIEPIPELAESLRKQYPLLDVRQVACAAGPGEQTLSIMSRSNLSTLATPRPDDRPVRQITVDVTTVADICKELRIKPNVCVIDAQGLELEVLYGTELSNAEFDLVIVETCTVRDHTMSAYYPDVWQYMDSHGYMPVGKWSRDYMWLYKWGRGRRAKPGTMGTVDDVWFVPKVS